MNSTSAKRLESMGRFREAIAALSSEDVRREQPSVELLRAELLANVGESSASLRVLERLEKSKSLNGVDRSHWEFVMALVERERADFDSAIKHLQKSASLAERTRDLERLCWAQLQLMHLIADRSGSESAGSLLAGLRANVTKLGDSNLTAALHIVVGQVDGKRGLLASAFDHTKLALRLLESSPNAWLESAARINATVLSILQSDFEQALQEAERALTAALESGSLWAIRSGLGNLGHIHMTRGEFELALSYFNRMLQQAHSLNEHAFIARESIAQVHLAQGNLDGCAGFLAQPDEPTYAIGGYTHRHALFTRAQIYLRLQRWEESESCARRILDAATRADDGPLLAMTNLYKAELLLRLAKPNDAQNAIALVGPSITRHAPDMAARYERAIACLLAGTGRGSAGRRHFDRAQRIYQGLGNTPALIELARSWDAAENLGLDASPADSSGDPGSKARNLLQNVATWMLHAGRPELLATGLIAILADSESAAGAVAVARDPDGSEESLASFGTLTDSAQTSTIALGTSRNRAVEVRMQPLPDIESQVTLNSITMLLGTVRDLERANAEREERLTLWPLEELPFGDDDALIMGRMRELMTFARKVAQTNVTVLITGESGTGKEVLARAIHAYSQRAKKAFVPFNCTAIPRELLESQLFGYRRGAFTGAERDNPGIIRTARDGTLFLDEVGELGLDLQPKLLRFLESGEINPLGETSPLLIDVRIVAATNANLDQLVETGRFREDLFYRLNVIRLAIPPLRERRDEIPGLVHHFVAKAAREFKKGRIRVAEETMERIILYSWPGNVRQLQNELRRMVALSDADSTLTPIGLSKPIRQETMHAARNPEGPELAVPLTDKLLPTITRVEREMIKVALRANQGHLESTAKALGISRKGLYLKRQRLGV